jgi:hypothetical protein
MRIGFTVAGVEGALDDVNSYGDDAESFIATNLNTLL